MRLYGSAFGFPLRLSWIQAASDGRSERPLKCFYTVIEPAPTGIEPRCLPTAIVCRLGSAQR